MTPSPSICRATARGGSGVDAGQPPRCDRGGHAARRRAGRAFRRWLRRDVGGRCRTGLVGHIVYLAAALPREGKTYPEAMVMRDSRGRRVRCRRRRDDGVLGIRRRRRHDVRRLRRCAAYFYHDCDETTARWAFDQLGPERFGDTTVTPVSVPAFWAADLPRSFIRCLQDQSMPRWLADTVTRRLGVEQLTIDTSHSPFFAALASSRNYSCTRRRRGPPARSCPTRPRSRRNGIPERRSGRFHPQNPFLRSAKPAALSPDPPNRGPRR